MTVYAAGALCWRVVGGQLMVAMIYRGRYKDWGWPKGKQDPGECLPETAVREISEETGLKIRLGVRLGIQKYALASGEPKEVHYWAAKVTDKTVARSKFKPSEEVAEVTWVRAQDAFALLTYPKDAEPLQALIDIHTQDSLDTLPFVVLRHAKATPRSEWNKEDGKRPLLPLGKKQAQSLVPLLSAFPIKRVVTSPWVRCFTTVQPYAIKRKSTIIQRSQLSELGNKQGPQRTEKIVSDLIDDGIATLLCAHRPSLPNVLNALAKHAGEQQSEVIRAAKALKPGHLLVAHMSVPRPNAAIKVVAVETYAPIIE